MDKHSAVKPWATKDHTTKVIMLTWLNYIDMIHCKEIRVFLKRLTQILGIWLVEMAISTNHMPKIWVSRANALTAILNNYIFHTLKVVCRYLYPQLQVGERHSYNMFNLSTAICKSCCLNGHFIPKNCDLNW